MANYRTKTHNMDPATATCVLSFGASMLLEFLKRRRCRVSAVVGLIIPSKGGASRLVSSLAQSNKYVILDLAENIKMTLSEKELTVFNSLDRSNPSFALHIQPILKAYINKVKKDFKGKRIIVVSSSKQDLEYAGITNPIAFIPNSEFTEMLSNSLEAHEKAALRDSRLELLLQTKERNRIVYESFDDLKKRVCQQFNLSLKI